LCLCVDGVDVLSNYGTLGDENGDCFVDRGLYFGGKCQIVSTALWNLSIGDISVEKGPAFEWF